MAAAPTRFGVVSPAGWTVTALAALGLLGGWTLGWVEFVIVGCSALVALALAALWIAAPISLEVNRRLSSRWVTVGEPVEEVLSVTNTGRFRTLPHTITEPVGGLPVAIRLPSILAGATHDVRITLPTSERGLLHVGPTWTGRIDPLGLFVREATDGSYERLMVRPRVHDVSLRQHRFVGDVDLDDSPSRSSLQSGEVFRGVRPYDLGDDVRAVHWRSTAKRSQLMVRHHGAASEEKMAVLVDTFAGSYLSTEAFELAVEIAASLASAAARQQHEVLLWAVRNEASETPAPEMLHAFRPAAGLPDTKAYLDVLAALRWQRVAPFERAVATGLKSLASHARSALGEVAVVTGTVDNETVASTLGSLGHDVVTIRCIDGGSRSTATTESTSRTIDVVSADDFRQAWARRSVQ